ncbi:MAG: SGNH/GDSL hydrolase family protein [Candidatus Saccharimonadales bacterium]
MRYIKTIVIISIGIVSIGLIFVHTQSNKKPLEQQKPIKTSSHEIRYLPLGDSYTIGQSVIESDRWPNQLVSSLNKQDKALVIVANPAVTGYTSQDLISKELPLIDTVKPDFVTIQIGVNDYVRGMSAETFRLNLQKIIQSVKSALPDPSNILLVSIPDYSKTPTGSTFGDPHKSENGVRQFNTIITDVARQNNLPVSDIFPVSQNVSNDPTLIAGDGLHPSGKQYASWVDIILKTIETTPSLHLQK